jgi:cobalt/nickel transport system permease protein
MIRESFAIGNSLIHRLDPRLKVVVATTFSFVVALSTELTTFAALVLSVLLIGVARLNIREVARRLVVVNGLIVFFWVVLPLTFQGDVLFHIGPLSVTWSGLFLAAQITLKSNAILLAFLALVTSLSIATLGHVLSRLRVPEKIIYLLLLTYRYVFVIEEEYERLMRAAKIRGFQPANNMHTYRTYAYLIGMILVRASARAERVHQAMLCRGFKGRFYSLHEFSLSRVDWIWLALMTTAITGLEILEWTKTV